jgi:hypothetical protein
MGSDVGNWEWEGQLVKYVILIYSNPARWAHPMFLNLRESLSDEEQSGMLGQFQELMDEINESGEMISSGALADPGTTKTVRAYGGIPEITDGPFAEAKEQLAGFFEIDCESQERALEIASRFPDIRFHPIEVRPIMDLSGMEM